MVSNKKSYATPQLIVHGNVEQLTQNRWGCGRVDTLGSGLEGPFGETSDPTSSQCNPPKGGNR